MIKPHKIIRTARKTIALIVNQEGQLIVRAPKRVNDQQIWGFIEAKQDWIASRQAAAREKRALIIRHAFKEGEMFLYLGEDYPLVITAAPRPAIAFKNGQFELSCSAVPQAAEIFTRWYRQQARTVLEERTRALASKHRLSFERLRISSAQTRWGSCSSLGTISFTWRLVMAPLPIIDYVIVHELAHLVEKNHSQRFWEKVTSMMPNYQECRRWLKENGSRLILE